MKKQIDKLEKLAPQLFMAAIKSMIRVFVVVCTLFAQTSTAARALLSSKILIKPGAMML